MKNIIIVLIVVLLQASAAIAQQRTNMVMNGEFGDYEDCKRIILNDIENERNVCIMQGGTEQGCTLTRREVNGTVRAECGVSDTPRQQTGE